MKTIILSVSALFALLALAGCGAKDDAASTKSDSASSSSGTASNALGPIATAAAYEVGSKKLGDKGVCVVCSVNGGAVGEEEDVKQTLDYEGKTFVFCNESEKADFISDPKKYVAK